MPARGRRLRGGTGLVAWHAGLGAPPGLRAAKRMRIGIGCAVQGEVTTRTRRLTTFPGESTMPTQPSSPKCADRKRFAMSFPTFPADLDSKALATIEKTKKVQTDLVEDLADLKKAFGKIDDNAFAVPKKMTNEQELDSFEKQIDGEMGKIKAFRKSLTDFGKQATAKNAEL